MTRNNFWYLRNVVADLRIAIKKGFEDDKWFNYGKLLAIRSTGLKVDKKMASVLIEIYCKSEDLFLSINPDDVNLDDCVRIFRLL